MDPMTAMAIFGGMQSMAGGQQGAMAAKLQSEFESMMFDTNASLSAMQATEVLRKGDLEASQQVGKTKRLIGSQRAALAAQGIDVNEGSALEAQDTTATLGALDAATIRNNAFREAWGLQMQQIDYKAKAGYARLGGSVRAEASLATGGMGALQGGLKAASTYSRDSSKNTTKAQVMSENYDLSKYRGYA